MPPRDISIPTPESDFNRSTLAVRAVSFASLIHAEYLLKSMSIKISSLEKPVSRVRSISFVVLRSPHLCKAMPPMKQN